MSEKPLSPDAQAIAQEFKDFAYIVSHDLSGPLRAVVEFSKLLKAEDASGLSEDGKEYLSLIIESGQKMQHMLLSLLDYSRLNTMAKPFTHADCNRILKDCRVVLQDKIKASNGTLDIADLPVMTADVEQLMQLFLILIDNALTYHGENITPQVAVSAKKNNSEWVFSIRDNGIGIEESFRQRIFKPFRRLHTESEYPGMGMGLALAKKIVERHGGRIWMDSAPGHGSCFLFTLPHQETC